jgi:IS30 family transposase
LEPLTVGSHKDHRLTNIDEALMAMGGDFSPEQLAAALDAQTEVEVTVSTLYRWRRELVG